MDNQNGMDSVVRAREDSGLHFHDLRREFASRLLESSADLHDVQLFLGHANVTQTGTYLSSTPVRLEKALARMESAAGLTQKWHSAVGVSGRATRTERGVEAPNE